MQIAPSPSSASVSSARRRSDDPVSASVRVAGPADLAEVVRLVNQAYEVEAFFTDGPRTGLAEVAELTSRGDFLVLDRADGKPGLAGACFVRIDRSERDGDRGFLAMLSVAPDLRGHGIGRRLVGVAEALCTARGCVTMALKVVNLREELPPWYRSLGYSEAGTSPYEDATKRPCHFIEMTKPLA